MGAAESWESGFRRITGKALDTVGLDKSLVECHLTGRRRRAPEGDGVQRHPGLQSCLASVRGVGPLGSSTGNDPARAPIDGTEEGGGHGGSYVPEQQDQMGPRLRPQTGLGQEIPAGRSREAADLWAGSENVPGAGASLPGTLVSQCRRKRVTAKVGGGGGNEEGGEGKRGSQRQESWKAMLWV